MRLFILAGEPSGDRNAADLVERLRQQVRLELSGVGGDELKGQGLRSVFPMSDLSVMGITDVLLNLPKLLWRLEQTARAILADQPDLVVLVDAQDFSKLLASRLRKRGYRKPIILYVAPSVWARNPERAAKLKPLFDAVLAVLPFEPAVPQKLGGPPSWYVGHPALRERLETSDAKEAGPVLLLPGSRPGELRRHLPIFKALAPQLLLMPGVTELVIPTLPALRPRLQKELGSWSVPVNLVERRAERKELYSRALAALSVSGTATLELALARVPMVVIYALDAHQARIYHRLDRPAVSLPNIVLERPVVPELVATNLINDQVEALAANLITNKKARQAQIEAFGELSGMMVTGQAPHLREDPADRILALLRGQRPLIAS